MNRYEPSYGAIKRLAETYVLPGGAVHAPVLSAEGLLKAKRAMNRPKDQQDIIELEALEELREIEGTSTALVAGRGRSEIS